MRGSPAYQVGSGSSSSRGGALAAGEGAEPRHSHSFLKAESHRRCSPFTFLLRTASFRKPLRRADYPRLLLFERGERLCFYLSQSESHKTWIYAATRGGATTSAADRVVPTTLDLLSCGLRFNGEAAESLSGTLK